MTASAIRAQGHADVFTTNGRCEAVIRLLKWAREGDTLVTQGAGENIEWGSGGLMSSAQQALNGWKASSGHDANMLNSGYVAIGIARL